MKLSLCCWHSFSVAAMLIGSSIWAQDGGPSLGLINRAGIIYTDRNGKVYAVDSEHGAVAIVAANGTTKLLKTGLGPVSIAVNNQTGKVYVANSSGKSVAVLDGDTDKLLTTVPTAARPYAISVDEVSDRIYVSNTFSNMLTVIDGKTNTVTNLSTGSADAMVVDAQRGKVYLLGYESDSLTVLDEATHAISKIPAGALMCRMQQWRQSIQKRTLRMRSQLERCRVRLRWTPSVGRSMP
jgi:YVTN family beta-propeller protein